MIVIILNDSYLTQNKLLFQNDFTDFSFPTVKINYASIAQIIELEKNVLTFLLSSIISEISMILSNLQKGVLDLGILGKFKVQDGIIYFIPCDAQRHGSTNLSSTGGVSQGGSGSQYTVKGLMEMNKSVPKKLPKIDKEEELYEKMNESINNNNNLGNELNSTNMHNILGVLGSHGKEEGTLNNSHMYNTNEKSRSVKPSPITNRRMLRVSTPTQKDDSGNKSFSMHQGQGTSSGKKNGTGTGADLNMSYSHSNNNKMNNSSFYEDIEGSPDSRSPTRRFNKPDNTIVTSDMLGAGTDPLAREGGFSILANNANSLINAQFIKPNPLRIRFPPVLDKFSRTIGAPVSSLKYNLPPSMRIGANLTPTSQMLYIDHDSKCVQTLKKLDNTITFSANPEYLQKTASFREQMLYVVNKVRNQQLELQIRAKKTCYDRYQIYIEEEIGREYVAPIRQYWITDILDLIPGQFQYISKERMELLIDNMLVQVGDYYYNASRKSILDYVLKNEQEMYRLGIVQVFDALIDYGDNYFKGLEPDFSWRNAVVMARDDMYNKLVICNDASSQILYEWEDNYKNKYKLLTIPQFNDPEGQFITDFYQIQMSLIQESKTRLNTEFNSHLVQIYRRILNKLGNDEYYSNLFFQSTAMLISNLLRTHVTTQLNEYHDFVQLFRCDNLRSARQVLDDEKNDLIGCNLDKVFVKIEVDDDGKNFLFKDSILKVRERLLEVCEELVKFTHNVTRPEQVLVITEQTRLWEFPLNDELFLDQYRNIDEVVSTNLKNAESALEIFNEFNFILNEKDQVDKFIESDPKREDYVKELKKYDLLYNTVMEKVPFFFNMNMVFIEATNIQNQMLRMCEELKKKITDSIFVMIIKQNSTLNKEISLLLEQIGQISDTTQMVVQLEKQIENIQHQQQRRLMEDYQEIVKWLQFELNSTDRKISTEDLQLFYKTHDQIFGFMDQVDQQEERIKMEKEAIEEKVKLQREEFIQDIISLNGEIDNLQQYTSRFMAQEVNEIIRNINLKLQEMLHTRDRINEDEDLLGWGTTQFPKLNDAQINLRPFEDLWGLVEYYDTTIVGWTQDVSIFKLDPETIERETKTIFQTAMKMNLLFNPSGSLNTMAPIDNQKGAQKQVLGPQRLSSDLVQEIQEFQKSVPLVRALCNPGFKARHWQDVTKVVGFQLNSEKDYTLKRLVDMEIMLKLPELDEISEQASKEFAIEKILMKMLEDWEPIQVEIQTWKDTGTHIVGGASIEEIQQILDDQLVKTQTMKSSPYAKIFEKKILDWEDWLNYTLEFTQFWVQVQSVWIYLEPIFSSGDILKRLPHEGARFREVDRSWKEMMKFIHSNPQVLVFSKQKQLLEILKESNNKLEVVQKGLNAYLQGKRASFPRFYFLSNDELLEILSETKDPLKVQPHLKKCFEGIQKLRFDEDKKVHGMISTETEYVPFLPTGIVDTMAAQGNVDEWLLQTEDSMIQAVRHCIEVALGEYPKMKRNNWVQNRCGQAVLCISMTYWTSETERALNRGLQGVNDQLNFLQNSLDDIVALTRTQISVLDRCTVEALIVLDVHNKDIVATLVAEKIDQVSDFLWQSQLRYYWEDGNTKVKIINATCEYNYEYLGNSARLVITPLTDRCYRTLCGAIHLNYGGAPEGPAGTGKTETTQDLAKSLARQCVVFNCSDGLDYKAMGKFFKGLASSGAWSCFDEFNRIDLEVLSVVAQQILTIQLARGQQMQRFIFQDSEIPLQPTCNVFITMNPGYAGRSELPDNLKALFRSVAMMVPDYAMISEISLYSYGFSDGRNLARKIVTTYKLCSEQLSSQDHYDYGMRAVKSVLIAAGNLKRKYPNENQSILMLRAINDVNLAKFLNFDLPLFKGITSDLFPGVVLPEIDYSAMYTAIDDTIKELNYQQRHYFVQKTIQLYEMILVRHGLMVVGLPFAGKTSIIKVLAGALTKLQQRQQMNENKVQFTILNPKSIPMKLLYGCFDDVSHEWTDGVLAVKYRNFAKTDTDDRKWLIFDGPVDAVWIENMNTVLDDNKKLCLMSGEIIAMSKPMNLIFEPMDLQAASPATVSRCGMIYMEPAAMGWSHLYDSWKQVSLPETLLPEDRAEIDLLFQWFVDAGLAFIRSKCEEISPTQDQNLVLSLMRIFGISLQDFENADFNSQFQETQPRNTVIDNKFIFSFIWSIGGSVNTAHRKTFDHFVKNLVQGDVVVNGQDLKGKQKISVPDRGTVFDYALVKRTSNLGSGGKTTVSLDFVNWTDTIDPETFSPKMLVQEILVKTSDTARYSFLLDMMIQLEHPTLFCGPTGTGQSTYIKNVLANNLSADKYAIIEIGFSAQTSCTQTQEIVDSKVDRRRKGHFAPKIGKGVIFVDDLNMPTQEKWGAQPPIEILRQYLDQGGWYDNQDKEKPFKNLIQMVLVGAMGPPGGGRTFITPRILRHFTLVSLTNFQDDTLNRIFGTILDWFFQTRGFSQDISKFTPQIIQGTLDIYKTAMSDLLPTPMKSHYLFNLRDFAKVIFGFCFCDKDKVNSAQFINRIWVHEVWRVFGDRLINDEDRLFLLDMLRKATTRAFGLNFDQVFSYLDQQDPKTGRKDNKVDTIDEIRGLMWTDVIHPVGAPKRYYEEISDYTKLQAAIDTGLNNFNMMTDKPMDLVLFSFAIEHLLVIARILKSPGGNGLLVGVGGSGRQSLTRLASYLHDYTVMQIEITQTYGKTEFHEDLKRIMKSAGGKGYPTVFIFTDSQIKQQAFVEDINNLLNTAEVPNLFPNDEKAELMQMVRPSATAEGQAQEGTPAQLYSYFIERVQQNLHIMLCFSPIGDAFRTRVRMFPSLVNCCTIDWFSEWPQDALMSVAQKFLSTISMEPKVKDSCVEVLQHYHVSTSLWAKEFFKQLRRKYYVTPTSYIDMITSFSNLLEEKRNQVISDQNKYDNGFQQIVKTEQTIEQMQVNLIALQPQLQEAAIATEKKFKEVEEQKGEADILSQVTGQEEAIVKAAVAEASAIKQECEKDLEEAMPALNAAEAALKVLNKSKIDELKAMKNPPAVIKVVMEALCYIMYPNPTEKVKNQTTLKMEIDWWAASIKLLGRPTLLDDLLEFDQENVEESIINKLGVYLKTNEQSLEITVVENASVACKCIIMWIQGIFDFYYVNKKVKPKKIKYAESSEKTKQLTQQLEQKQKELKKSTDLVNALNSELETTQRHKESLEREYENCSVQLERAKQLIESLGGEKGRWGELGKELRQEYIKLTGDVLVASGLIAYLGAFTSAFRSTISTQWADFVKSKEIPGNEVFSFARVLGDQVKIRAWNIDGLPSDNFSIENGIIISKSRRWPLCIDPQGQANQWIKQMEAPKKLSIIKLSDSDFLRTLENAIQFGKPVLLENVAQELDPSLFPILLKQTYQKGSTVYLKLGDQTLQYSSDFRFYITTKLRNPHYLPEISTKVTLLNFMITYEGLNDQLLGILVKQERPDLEREKERLILQGADNKKQQYEIEEKILLVLSGQKNILTDEEAIKVLTASKEKSNEINEKQAIAEITEQNIDTSRQDYQDVSQQSSVLFFAITDLESIDPMYQYSLPYYIGLFEQAITNYPKNDSLAVRLENLKQYFLYSLYSNICRSLFEKDKLLLSFLICTRLLEFRKEITGDAYRFLLTGGLALDEKLPDQPKVKWLSVRAWSEICRLSNMQEFTDLYKTFYDSINEWQVIYDSPEPHKLPLPAAIKSKFNTFQRLLILRTFRPDKIIPAVQDFIIEQMGRKFIEPPPFDLAKVFQDSTALTPLIFILSPGSDPFASLNSFAEQKKQSITAISLGQGQGPFAIQVIMEGQKTGNWVVLQNCHLAVSWMTTLEKICEEFSPDPNVTNPDFRLWLTSYPSEKFPTAILQGGVKMTTEAPKGLKSNLVGSYLTDPINRPEFFDGCQQPKNFKRLLYSLCFFHAVIQQRRKYGPLGWNIPYEFNESDLRISVRQLQMFLNQSDERNIPFAALKYLTAECNYGGRVTDDKDRRLILTLLNDYYNQEVITNMAYKFSPDPKYKIPEEAQTSDQYLEFIQNLPMNSHPEVFGFHANADITQDINETNLLLNSLLLCTGGGGGSEGGSNDDILNKLVQNIIGDFPLEFDINECVQKFPVKYEQSMNTVLTQELTRFNALIRVVRSSLTDIKLALQGQILLSLALERASKSLFDGKVPDLWMEQSYPSLQPLSSYVSDLRQRLQFFQTWIDQGQAPEKFWISGFYFTQSFLTGVLQNFARQKTIPIDEVQFDFQVLKEDNITHKPDDGAYVWGLFTEGCKFNKEIMELDESDPKVLFVECPIILLKPSHFKNIQEFPNYNCPVYKTTARRGVLSTTGHSTNFVMWIKLPSQRPEKHWVQRGVALLTQLDD